MAYAIVVLFCTCACTVYRLKTNIERNSYKLQLFGQGLRRRSHTELKVNRRRAMNDQSRESSKYVYYKWKFSMENRCHAEFRLVSSGANEFTLSFLRQYSRWFLMSNGRCLITKYTLMVGARPLNTPCLYMLRERAM